MKPKATEKKVSPYSPILIQRIRKSLIIYLLSAVIVPAICFVFGWRSLDSIGTGFIYGSLCLALFGAFILAGNTVPAQLSQLSLPKYMIPSLRRHQNDESADSPSMDVGIRFFFTTIVCGAFLFVTGLVLRML